MVKRAVSKYGRIDILCNNAGIGSTTDVAEYEPEEWDRVMTVNVKSVYLASDDAAFITGAGFVIDGGWTAA